MISIPLQDFIIYYYATRALQLRKIKLSKMQNAFKIELKQTVLAKRDHTTFFITTMKKRVS